MILFCLFGLLVVETPAIALRIASYFQQVWIYFMQFTLLRLQKSV